MTKMSMGCAKAIVSCMKLEQVEKVFCVPGESYLPLMDAIYDEPTIDLISTRHEGGAAFMAEGYAKATGKPGVVMATRAVGGANAAIGVHTAFQDSTPMIVFLGQVHSKFRGREGFQEVDLDRFFAPIAKWTVELNDAERAVEIVQRAFRIAQSGRPGPVIISLPEDMLKQTATYVLGPPVKKPAPAPNSYEIAMIESYLQTAKKPLIIAGGGVISANGEEELIAFAEQNDLPVVAAFRRHDVFPNHHPLYCGHLGLGTDKQILATVKLADVIIAIGTRLSEVTTQDYSLLSTNQTLIHIDIDEDILGKTYPPTVGVIADAKEALNALRQIDVNGNWQNWITTRRVVYEASCKQSIEFDKETLTNDDVIFVLRRCLPANAIMTNDAGNFAGWVHTYYQFQQKRTYIGPTSGAMGYGLLAAIGAKLAHPDRIVVSLSGDGGMLMTIQELETAVRYQVPIIAIVFNNCMYGTIRMHQEMHFPHKVIGTQLSDIDFVGLAKSLGASGVLVNSPKHLEEALLDAMKSNVPTLIEISMEQEQISVAHTITQLRKQSL